PDRREGASRGRGDGEAHRTRRRLRARPVHAAGGEFFYDTTALGLVLGEEGRIVGIDVRDTSGATVRVDTQAVILASGGFEGNPEWLTRYIPEAWPLPPYVLNSHTNECTVCALS
ncbi:FAD-binding protein, partial [Streptomyces sp. MCAF7]